MTADPTTNAERARRASQLLAEIDTDERTPHVLAAELSADAANLAAELNDEPNDGESYRTQL